RPRTILEATLRAQGQVLFPQGGRALLLGRDPVAVARVRGLPMLLEPPDKFTNGGAADLRARLQGVVEPAPGEVCRGDESDFIAEDIHLCVKLGRFGAKLALYPPVHERLQRIKVNGSRDNVHWRHRRKKLYFPRFGIDLWLRVSDVRTR